MKTFPFLFAALLLFLSGGVLSVHAADGPDISEFMASNDKTTQDGDGAYSDWIEIHNRGATDIELQNWSLTDNPGEFRKWVFPPQTVPAGGYLLIFASGQDRKDGAGNLHTNFKLGAAGEYLALVKPDGITVAREFSPAFPPQTADVSWGTPDGLTFGPYKTPTPGAANGPIDSLDAAVVIDPPGGTFTGASRAVTLTASLPAGAMIRYTLNGTAPSAASPVYNEPLNISNNTRIRARVFQDGLNPGPEASAVYLKLGAGMEAFSSNLPLILLDTDAAIAGSASTNLTGSSAVMIDTAANGRAAVNGPADYSGRTGLRLRGRSSQSFPQRQYKMETWDAGGREIDTPLFGLPAGSDWVLHAPYTDKSLIRNALAYQLWAEMNHPSLRFRFVEVFLNDDGGGEFTFADDYAGIYLLVESINVERAGLEPPENTTDPAGITGGFITETGNADSQEFTTTGAGRTVAHSHRDPGRAQLNTAQRAWVRNRILDFERALYNTNFKHPVTGLHYREYTDAASHADYRVMREWSRNFDGGSTNSHIPRGGKLTMGPLWDYNWAFGNVNYAEGGDIPAYRADGWNRSFTANVNGWAPWWLRLEQDPDWWQEFIDRWGGLRAGLLADAAVDARIGTLIAPLAAEAADRHFTRWPQLGAFTVISAPGWQNRKTYQSEVDYLKTWLRDRAAWMDRQFPAAPVFSPAPGAVGAGASVTVTAAAGETVYLMMDGSDPRLPGGGVRPDAITPGGGLTLNASMLLTARARKNSVWGSPRAAAYVTGTPASAENVILSEISYHPSNPTQEELEIDPYLADEDFEFLELRNISAGPLDLTGTAFTNGIRFTFPGGSTLTAGACLVLAKNPAAYALRYPQAPPAAGFYTGNLSNSGERLTLTAADGSEIMNVRYRDSWSAAADGGGFTLTLLDASQRPVDYSLPGAWGIGVASPGSADGTGMASDFALWRLTHFSGTDLSDAKRSGPAADPDGDGCSNLLEFSLCSLPLDAASQPSLSLRRAGATVSLSYKRPVRPVNLSCVVEYSDDLLQWAPAEGAPAVESVEGDGLEERVSIVYPVAEGKTRGWFRLRVSQP